MFQNWESLWLKLKTAFQKDWGPMQFHKPKVYGSKFTNLFQLSFNLSHGVEVLLSSRTRLGSPSSIWPWPAAWVRRISLWQVFLALEIQGFHVSWGGGCSQFDVWNIPMTHFSAESVRWSFSCSFLWSSCAERARKSPHWERCLRHVDFGVKEAVLLFAQTNSTVFLS